MVGAGAFGGWTALYLREMGHAVTLIDQYGPGNARATSGGESRQIRAVYGEREIYTKWVLEAFDRWQAQRSGVGQEAVLPHRPAVAGAGLDEGADRHEEGVRPSRGQVRHREARRPGAPVPADEHEQRRRRDVDAEHRRAEGARGVRGGGAGVREERRTVRHGEGGARDARRRRAAGRRALDRPAGVGADVRVRLRAVAAEGLPVGDEEQAGHAAARGLLLRHASRRRTLHLPELSDLVGRQRVRLSEHRGQRVQGGADLRARARRSRHAGACADRRRAAQGPRVRGRSGFLPSRGSRSSTAGSASGRTASTITSSSSRIRS